VVNTLFSISPCYCICTVTFSITFRTDVSDFRTIYALLPLPCTHRTGSVMWIDRTSIAGTIGAGEATLASVRQRRPLGSNGNCRRMRVRVLASIQLVHRPQSAAIFVYDARHAAALAMQPPIVGSSSSSSSFRWSCSSRALCSARLQVSERRRYGRTDVDRCGWTRHLG